MHITLIWYWAAKSKISALSGKVCLFQLMSWAINKIPFMENLFIANERQNIINIVYYLKIWQTVMNGGIGEMEVWVWMGNIYLLCFKFPGKIYQKIKKK